MLRRQEAWEEAWGRPQKEEEEEEEEEGYPSCEEEGYPSCSGP
jgi:hypothetical protein